MLPDFKSVWEKIVNKSNQQFETKTGLPFTLLEVENDVIKIKIQNGNEHQESKEIAKQCYEIWCQNYPNCKPKDLQKTNTQNAAYIWGIFNDARIVDLSSGTIGSSGKLPSNVESCNSCSDTEKILVLVGCGSRKNRNAKVDSPVAAKDLYTSSYFQSKRILAELYQWRILTNYQEPGIRMYDLLCPEEPVYCYDKKNKQYDEQWAAIITQQIRAFFPEGRIIIFAGKPVWEFLVPQLEADGYKVCLPFGHRRIGEQIRWLNDEVEALTQGNPRNSEFRQRRKTFWKRWCR